MCSQMRFHRLILGFATLFLLASVQFGLSANEAFQIGFRVGASGIDTTYMYNARACARIYGVINAFDGAAVKVTAYSSPDGKFSRNRQLAALRAASAKDYVLSLSPSSEVNTVVVAEDWDGVKKYLQRSSLEWKDDALAILSSKEGDKKALLQDLWVGEAWEDLLKNCFPSLRRVVISVESNASGASVEVSGLPEIVFRSGSSAIDRSYLNNRSGLEKLSNYAGAQCLYIYVKASPEGDEAANEKLSIRRAERIKAHLKATGYAGEVVTVYKGEDWEGLAGKVRESSDLPDKDAVLDILGNSSLSRDQRKKALQALSYGHTWLRLMEEEMQELRKAVVSAENQ